MRITILNQFYKPDLAPTGHLAASLAEHRAAQGDTVTVITSLGGYVKSSPVASSDEGGGNLRVFRLWTPRLGKNRSLFRIIDYSFFYVQAALRTLFLPSQDVIVSLTTPPFIAWTGALHKFINPSTKLVLWNMDSYPEILERTGVISEGSTASRFLRALNKALFRRLDYLVCLDDAMCQLLTSSYLPEESQLLSTVIPNWESLNLFSEPQPQGHLPGSLGMNLEDKFVILYLGNAGFGHSFETVLEAAIKLKQEPVVFLFVGGGKKWPLLEKQKNQRGLDNLLLHSYVRKEVTPAVMTLADCALITLNRPALGVISPSKLHSNLAMGLPIIYVGPEGGNVDEAIASFNCGTSIRHGEVDRLVDFIESLLTNRDLLETYRRNARHAFDEAYNDRVTLPKFDQIIAALRPSSD